MLRTRQKVNSEGIHIPLPYVEQYGLLPSAEVIVEFGPDGIFLSPAQLDAEKIETLALHLLFRKLGDAVKVSAEQVSDSHDNVNLWRMDVYASDARLLLGQMFYTADGELLTERSTSFEAMRRKAIEHIAV